MPSWTLPTLTYHEGIPGHHLQGSIPAKPALAADPQALLLRGYIEGWALYAEQLAARWACTTTIRSAASASCTIAMFRAVRLVVDTGLHAMRWSREQAIKYYIDTLGDQDASAATEVERYCVWPGQACTYMLGKLTFLAEREKAKRPPARTSASANFTIRCSPGAVPLDLLDRLLQA